MMGDGGVPIGLMPLAVVWHTLFFWIFGMAAGGFAIGVLLEKNVVRMALYLIASLSATAGLFFLAGAHFVGAMQIMIYVGGTLVLLIFGVMLTAQTAFLSLRTPSGEWVLSAVIGAVLFALLVTTAFSVPAWRTANSDRTAATADDVEWTAPIGLSLIGIRADAPDEAGPDSIAMASGYLLPFEVVSVHLLIVLIGAAFLARTKVQLPRRST